MKLLDILKALAIESNNAEALNNKGVALSNSGEYYEAIKYFDKSLEIRPGYSTALDNKNKILDLLAKQK